MQYEKISASNKYSVTVTLSRPMAEFLSNIIDTEIYNDEIGSPRFDGRKLRRLADIFWHHLKPTPEQKKAKFENWVRKLNLGRFDTRVSAVQKKRLQGGLLEAASL